jgi:predicted NAD/FAD-binding protein
MSVDSRGSIAVIRGGLSCAWVLSERKARHIRLERAAVEIEGA